MDLDDYRCTKCGCKSEICCCWDEAAPESDESLPTDKQQLKPAISLVLDQAEQLFLEEGQFDTLKKYCDLLAKRAGV